MVLYLINLILFVECQSIVIINQYFLFGLLTFYELQEDSLLLATNSLIVSVSYIVDSLVSNFTDSTKLANAVLMFSIFTVFENQKLALDSCES